MIRLFYHSLIDKELHSDIRAIMFTAAKRTLFLQLLQPTLQKTGTHVLDACKNDTYLGGTLEETWKYKEGKENAHSLIFLCITRLITVLISQCCCEN